MNIIKKIFKDLYLKEILMKCYNTNLLIEDRKLSENIQIIKINESNYKNFINEQYNIKKTIHLKNCFCYGLLIDSIPVSYACFVTKNGNAKLFKIKADLYIETLYTFTDFRGKGYIKILLNECLKKFEYNYVHLCVNEKNTRAYELYKKIGFTEYKKVKLIKKSFIRFPRYIIK